MMDNQSISRPLLVMRPEFAGPGENGKGTLPNMEQVPSEFDGDPPEDPLGNNSTPVYDEVYENGMSEEGKRKFAVFPWLKHRARSYCSRDEWIKRVPIIGFVKGYNLSKFIADVIAGVAVALILIPQSIAIAQVAGMPAQYGLYSSIIPLFVYTVFGSLREITCGPTPVMGILLRPFVLRFGPDVIILITFCSGIFVIIFAMLKLLFIVDFISVPVLVGFLSAAGLSTVSGQVGPLLGFRTTGQNVFQYWVANAQNFYQTRLWDAIVGVSSLAFLIGLDVISRFGNIPPGKEKEISRFGRIWRKILKYLGMARYTLVVIISAGIIAALTGDGEPPVFITGEVPEGLPRFRAPIFRVTIDNETLSFGEALSEMTGTIVIPLTMILGITTTAQMFAMGTDLDLKQEMLVVGFSNVLTSFIQGFIGTAAITRSGVNKASGVQTPIGCSVTGVVVLLFLAFFSTAVKYVPSATLAAIVMCAIYFSIRIPLMTIALWRSNKIELIPMWVAFLACCFLNLSIGIGISVGVNVAMILIQVARPKIIMDELTINGREVLLITPDRTISYPAAGRTKKAISKRCKKSGPGLIVIVSGSHLRYIDTTSVRTFKVIVRECRERGQQIAYWHFPKNVKNPICKIDGNDPGCFVYHDTIEEVVESLAPVPPEIVATKL